MKRLLGVILSLFWGSFQLNAQVVNPGMTDQYDSVAIGKVSVEGFVDTYFLYDFSAPPNHERPYAVSSIRNQEFNINLAYIDVKYRSEHLRARLIPGFGNYINSNYATELGTLKNLVEANAGVLLFPKKQIWLDVGVLGSPFTNESAISKDHLMYTRAIAPEFVPYFITGAKLTVPIGKQLTVYGYLINGWQNIQDQNRSLSIATQFEYRPNSNWLLNLNLYGGDESSKDRPQFRDRWFADIYAIWKSSGPWSATACAYYGIQQIQTINGRQTSGNWAQMNGVLQYAFNKRQSIAVRAEYVYDPEGIQITSINPQLAGLTTAGFGACYNHSLSKQALFRFEYRGFLSSKAQFYGENNGFAKDNHFLVTNLTVWF